MTKLYLRYIIYVIRSPRWRPSQSEVLTDKMEFKIMSQLFLNEIEKIVKLKEITFSYRIRVPRRRDFHLTDTLICDVNGLTDEEIAEKCEKATREKMNNMFDGDECEWKVVILKKTKIRH